MGNVKNLSGYAAVWFVVLCVACSDDDSSGSGSSAVGSGQAGSGAAGSGAAGSGAAGSGAAGGGGKGVTASCTSVLGMRKVKGATSTLTMTADGQPFDIALDDAAYEKNPVWDAGSAPSICGAITNQKAEVTLSAIVQLHQGGTPVLRLQILGVPAGTFDFSDPKPDKKPTGITGLWRQPSESATDVPVFKTGKVHVRPSPLAEGSAEVEFEAVEGTFLQSSKPFTLAGKLSGSFEKL